jgi:hypothetical protein
VFGAIVFGLLGLLHAYWASGGRFATGAVIPERRGVPLFKPSARVTWLVALLLWTGAACLLMQLGLLGRPLPWRLVTAGTWISAVVFLLRSVGDFRYVGFSKRYTDSRFAYWDTRVYSPTCFVLFVSCLCAALYRAT